MKGSFLYRRLAWAGVLFMTSMFPLGAAQAQVQAQAPAAGSAPTTRAAQTDLSAPCSVSAPAGAGNCPAPRGHQAPSEKLQGSAEFLGVCGLYGNTLESNLKLLCKKAYGPLNA
ncbi:MAG: hypothetical protein KGQ75_09920 [Sphingomonadales bacterium]|nr:hypothetical protein [Sphingomonadales bacterium]